MIPRFEVVPSDLLSLDYEVREDGAPAGKVCHTPLQALRKGTLCTAGVEYAVLREGVTRASYQLREADGTVRARAERQGASGSAYRLFFDRVQLLLKKQMLARRETYRISDPEGEAGSIVRESPLSRRMTVLLRKGAAALPREIVLFAIWLALLIHRKEGAAAE